jgi:proteic killer suppression protein
VIKNFKDKETEKIYNGLVSRKLPGNIQDAARRRLKYLNSAVRLDDLRVPPSNHFEALHGDKEGQYSVRINNQWRIVFNWNDGAENVRIEDYH